LVDLLFAKNEKEEKERRRMIPKKVDFLFFNKQTKLLG
jgi:hypothetical protein